jgi:hypothetical protein
LNVSFIWIELNSFPRKGSGGSYSPVFVPYLQKSMRFLSEFVNLMLNFCGFTRSSWYFKSIGTRVYHSIISFAVERFHAAEEPVVFWVVIFVKWKQMEILQCSSWIIKLIKSH